jgi:hypothetical protein
VVNVAKAVVTRALLEPSSNLVRSRGSLCLRDQSRCSGNLSGDVEQRRGVRGALGAARLGTRLERVVVSGGALDTRLVEDGHIGNDILDNLTSVVDIRLRGTSQHIGRTAGVCILDKDRPGQDAKALQPKDERREVVESHVGERRKASLSTVNGAQSQLEQCLLHPRLEQLYTQEAIGEGAKLY